MSVSASVLISAAYFKARSKSYSSNNATENLVKASEYISDSERMIGRPIVSRASF